MSGRTPPNANPLWPPSHPYLPRNGQPTGSEAVFDSHSAGETRAIGERLGRLATGDEVLALCGSLGAGKTCLVQGIGRGLGVRRTINSPSFVLMKTYEGRLRLVHWDWYRLETDDDLESAGFGDLQIERGVVVIEWADRFFHRLTPPLLQIEIEPTAPHSRRLAVSLCGKSSALAGLVRELKSWWTEREQSRFA